ncbi:HET-domain-containing protein [Mollisia scopiformis]|uniref:HET-domain-containing protein n=1 Tax=Mollisia scopiformis TaxID=149040 RepID=A0A194XHB0_MOLSC|nr:HET-domain-containing protein [Mollisia scopiformis]KUJ19514.1 HET-domain-containing protein [Mollisia scopiformis]
MEEFQYTPLPPGHKEIRLIRLQPGLPGTDIQIELFHAELSTEPVYEALSYVWGCPDRTRVIHVSKAAPTRQPVHKLAKVLNRFKSKKITANHQGTASLGIAENLFVALQHLRLPSKARVLWKDAICINQNDMDERSSEVLEMGSIYKNAHEVIVWLGPSSNDSNLALQTLSRIGEGIICHEVERTIEYRIGSWPATLSRNTEALISYTGCWLAIKDVLCREWFARLWVFQEIVLAQKASLLIGKHSLDWKIFASALQWLSVVSTRLDQGIQDLNMLTLLEHLWWFMTFGRNPTSLTIFQALGSTGRLLCSDQRDRLFAIRSLLDLEYATIIVPDYSLEVEEVYIRFAKAWLSQFDSVAFLCCCMSAEARPMGVKLQLPSWVPDWTCNSDAVDNFPSPRTACDSAAFARLIDGNVLGVQGVLVGKLNDVSQSITNVPKTDVELRELCCSWMQLLSRGDSADAESDVEALFSEMIVGGYVREKGASMQENLPTSEEIKAFLSGTDASEVVIGSIRRAYKSRHFFVTAEGLFGLGPASVKVGDCVAVVLGCDFPLVLRPEEPMGETYFRVVGPCYVPGIMFAEVLLGPLPSGWNVRMEIMGGDMQMFENRAIRTQQDPRMPLPPGWEYRYGPWERPRKEEAKKLKDVTWQWFENVETGEKTDFDPRFTPELLKARGVAIEEIFLLYDYNVGCLQGSSQEASRLSSTYLCSMSRVIKGLILKVLLWFLESCLKSFMMNYQIITPFIIPNDQTLEPSMVWSLTTG